MFKSVLFALLLSLPRISIATDCRIPFAKARLGLRAESLVDRLKYYSSIPFVWAKQMAHNGHGILSVLDIIKFRPLEGGLIAENHPWVSGIHPKTGKHIWHDNVIFRSDPHWSFEKDRVVLDRVGKFLSGMVERSASSERFPEGRPEYNESGKRVRRMPHAINYIHGAVHFNGGWIVLNDLAEGFFYFSNPRFRAEIRRFAREEKREVVIVFRDRDYDLGEYADFVAFLRTVFPWFSNSNGPKKKVLWGNPAPFATVNIITGNWITDIYQLKKPGAAETIVRDPISVDDYFVDGPYQGTRLDAKIPERLLKRLTARRLKMRGDQGNLFFVDQTELHSQDPGEK